MSYVSISHAVRVIVVSTVIVMLCSATAAGQTDSTTDLSAGLEADSSETASLNFQNADINDVIAAVSKITGRNFIVDSRVKGEVTVITQRPIDANAIYQTLLSVLEVLGYAAIPQGTTTQIVPVDEARSFGTTTQSDDYATDYVTRVVQLRNIAAANASEILKPLMPQAAQLAVSTDTNQVVITDRRRNIDRLVSLVRQVDRRDLAQFDVVKLQHSSAADVVASLQQAQQAQAPGQNAALPIAADGASNSVLVGGTPDQKIYIKELVRSLDVDTDSGTNTEIAYLQHASAVEAAPIIQKYAELQLQALKAENKSLQGLNNVIGVLPDPSINGLLISAPSQLIEPIRNVVRRLDIARAQVLVEAIIAEVSYSESQRLGINLAALGNNIAFANLLDTSAVTAFGSAIGGGGRDEVASALAQQGITAGAANIDGGTAFAALVSALETHNGSNILSIPTLVTVDNQEAQIQVGQEVPFITGSFTTPVSSGGNNGPVNPFQTVERKNVGLSLRLTPHITQGDTIRLQIAQESSSISGTQFNAVDIITNNRSLNTTVDVKNGKILVLGGLVDRQQQDTETRVPVLGSIPLLGRLFRSNSSSRQKRNLMVFIRPVIVRDPEESDYYTRLKYNGVRYAEEKAGNVDEWREIPTPVLPPISTYSTPISRPIQPLPGQADLPAPSRQGNQD